MRTSMWWKLALILALSGFLLIGFGLVMNARQASRLYDVYLGGKSLHTGLMLYSADNADHLPPHHWKALAITYAESKLDEMGDTEYALAESALGADLARLDPEFPLLIRATDAAGRDVFSLSDFERKGGRVSVVQVNGSSFSVPAAQVARHLGYGR